MVALYILPSGLSFAAIPLGYRVLAGGVLIPWRLGAHNDISYGVYIYAFPVQQMLVFSGFAAAGGFAHLAASTAVTLLFALAPWHVVEKPAMRLGRTIVHQLAGSGGGKPLANLATGQ